MERKEAGFTLFEAMIVIAILAIVATIGLPSFIRSLGNTRISTAMHLLSADMAMARNTAITRREQIVMCPMDENGLCANSLDWRKGWLVFTDPDGNRRPDRPVDILRVQSAPVGKGRIVVNSTRKYLRYQSDGRSANSNLTVRLCLGNQLRGRVIVNNLGRVRTERPSKTQPCPA